ncbi:AAA family ATPase [Gordonia sp. (in: high G+C Gram-positive bacteria)]|uniref:AAA family ATPase n=1 Tax=Gordonia sp. (in: high G+C Gram-positive bacteria) TaxID=84139 RepID=UPI003C773246
MRLHRLRVENFRGVASREIEFADAGVTVIEGDNEAGKSSMMEAFDLLLTTQASSKSKNVRAVQPSGRDVGTGIWAEISCGPWRFEYFKRFNRQPETSLTILEPAREQLAGREAHERVEQIFSESLDKTLFGALRLLQSADPKLGDLANSSALSQALDHAAGQAESDSDGGESPQMLELAAAVTTEYKKYFTLAQGRPTGELADAQAAAASAAKQVAEREEILKGVQDAADRLPRVAESIRQLLVDEQQRDVDASTASAALTEAEAVGEKATAARAIVETKAMVHKQALAAVTAREHARARLSKLRASAEANAVAIAEARKHAGVSTKQAEALAAELATSQAALASMRTDLAAAEAASRIAADRARLARLDQTLAEVGRLRTELTSAQHQVAAIVVTDDDVRLAAALDRDLTALTARLDAATATVSVTRLGTTDVLIGGDTIDHRREVSAADVTVIEVPGVARIEVLPGADSAVLATELAGLREREEALLARCGLKSLAEVAPAANRRAEAVRQIAEAERAIARELGGTRTEDLEKQRLDIVGRLPEPSDEAAGDPVELRRAERELADLIAQADRRRDALIASASEQTLRATTLEESGVRSVEEAAALSAEIDSAAAEASDEMLVERVVQAQTDLDAATAVLAKVREQLAKLNLNGLRGALSEAEAAQTRVRQQLAEQKRLQTELSTRLDVCRADGRLDELSDAVAENDAASAQLKRVSERAAGARVLHETLQRKRNESRARYVDPFTDRLEKLAGPVFGDDVKFGVDDDFVISTRTLDGVTVDVEALSGGAKEQLGLLARLACATLVDEADGVPLILDDALGYTDPTRLASMAQVLGTSGGDAQIIVLTCTPDRYRDVVGAKLIAV